MNEQDEITSTPRREITVFVTADNREGGRMAKIEAMNVSKEEAKDLMESFVGYFESLSMVSWAMVEAYITRYTVEIKNLIGQALDAMSYGDDDEDGNPTFVWRGDFDGTAFESITLIPYVGDRFITISRASEVSDNGWNVVIDYTARPTHNHRYSPKWVQYKIWQPAPEAPVVATPSPATEEDDEDDAKYFGASTLAKLRGSKLFDNED